MRVLAFGPHPGAIEWGAAAYLRYLVSKEAVIYPIVFSDCRDAVRRYTVAQFIDEMNTAASIIDMGEPYVDKFKVREFSKDRQQILDKVIDWRDKVNPDLVLAPSPNAFHQDYRTLGQEVYRAMFRKHVNLIAYEYPSDPSFRPTVYFPMTEDMVKFKVKVWSSFRSHIDSRPHASVDDLVAQCKIRGAQCGMPYAEAFEMLYGIVL